MLSLFLQHDQQHKQVNLMSYALDRSEVIAAPSGSLISINFETGKAYITIADLGHIVDERLDGSEDFWPISHLKEEIEEKTDETAWNYGIFELRGGHWVAIKSINKVRRWDAYSSSERDVTLTLLD